MNATQSVPKRDLLLDHRGAVKPSLDMPLDYEAARLGVAFHEAGHAVLAMAYGIHVASSEVMSWSVGDGGWGLTGGTRLSVEHVGEWQYAAMCAAGEVAQVQYLMLAGLWTPERALACTAAHDREQAVDVLAAHGYRLGRTHVPPGGRSWGQVRGMARRRICHLWREIRTVAHAMNEATVLTGEEIAGMTGLTNPEQAGGAA
ncbi:hypothetical protein RB625_26940 [Streptomyces californicus]|uniref:hypothetical protein n=1 Tax=Streptomyces californicus TaxID=67351 RepID=UPI00296E85C9|nr:hypothetical protein [Streptomyces californicus]MDW4902058.1 hypothetical protein [Streptomyces californicus]